MVAVGATLLAAWSLTGRIAITNSNFNRITNGMTKQEVIAVAGRPHEIDSIEDNAWSYTIWNGFVPYSDPRYVFFDQNDLVESTH